MQKNIAVFIVACLAIILGWFWLQQQIWPPRRPDPQQIAKKDPAKKDDAKKADEKKNAEKKDAKPSDVKPPEIKPELKPKPGEKLPPEPPPQTYTLGNADTHLEVVLTTRGAGVQKLTLNRFKAADYLGKPVDRNLDLIPEDMFVPSFLMYHFADVEAKYPVFGLEKNWQFDGRDKLADATEEIKFSTRVPGLEHIKITKTYRLGPKDYHLGLQVEIERDKQGGDPKGYKFRYQLTGAHGLPIEGEWYTSTFRKAVIGRLEPTRTLSVTGRRLSSKRSTVGPFSVQTASTTVSCVTRRSSARTGVLMRATSSPATAARPS